MFDQNPSNQNLRVQSSTFRYPGWEETIQFGADELFSCRLNYHNSDFPAGMTLKCGARRLTNNLHRSSNRSN